MSQNSNFQPGGTRSGKRAILIVGLSLAVVIIVVTGMLAYFSLNHTTGPTGQGSTATPGGNPGPITNCSADSPYGFTTIHADTQLVGFYKQLGVCWVRFQYHWGKQKAKPGIETDTGVYQWGPVDEAIQAMNAANIHVDFAIQYAPQWRLSQVCEGQLFLPGPNDMAQFATLIATRYDGQHGHGRIDAFEIGNEEYDSFYIAGDPNSLQCRNANYYGPVLKAGYQAIKAANPHALVGMFGMWYQNLQHVKDFMTYLYSHGYGQYMDYMNYHYYNGNGNPAVAVGDQPSFDQWWQTMHDIAAHYGFPNKPIWVTEIGWPTTLGFNAKSVVTPQEQAQYMQYVLDEAAKSHVVQKVFWFTINYGKQSDTVYPPSGPLPAFYTLQQMVKQHPLWS
jgi:Glycosyl hydrolase catalytic core